MGGKGWRGERCGRRAPDGGGDSRGRDPPPKLGRHILGTLRPNSRLVPGSKHSHYSHLEHITIGSFVMLTNEIMKSGTETNLLDKYGLHI